MFELPSAAECRVVSVPTCEPDQDLSANGVVALATFQIRLRDTIDFTADFGAWLAANGNASLTTGSAWAVASGSPKTPTIAGGGYSPQGRIVTVLSCPNGAVVGDAFWMDVTANIAATTPTNPGDVAIPARSIKRRVNIIVVNG